MSINYNKYYLATFLFFLIYFLSYFNGNVSIKYLVLIIYQIFLLLNIRNNQHCKLSRWGVISVCGLSLSLLFSTFINFNSSGLVKTLSLIDLLLFTYYLFPKIAIQKIDEIKYLKLVSNSLVITLTIGLVFHYNDTLVSIGRSTGDGVRHLFGFGEASIAGFLCFIEYVSSFSLLCLEKDFKERIFNILKIILSLSMAYLSDIRAAMYVIIVFTAFYFYYSVPKGKYKKIFDALLIFILLFVAIYFVFGFSLDINRLNYILSNRLLYFTRSINTVVENHSILFGLGSFRNSEVGNLSRIQVDNTFIDLFYQYGIIVLAFFCLLLLTIYLNLRKVGQYIKSGTNDYKLDKILNSFFITNIVYSMVEKNLFSISSAVSLVFFLVLFWYIEKSKSQILSTKQLLNADQGGGEYE